MKKITNKTGKKGFTLIELLVVIAILAVLAVVVVLTLNPAGLLQESRDSSRVSDMATLKSALSLYMADYPQPQLVPNGSSSICYVSVATTSWNVTDVSNNATPTTTCASWFPSTLGNTVVIATTSANARSVASTTGWIPVDLSALASGAPFAVWPVDPINGVSGGVNYFYSYTASTTGSVFKIAMFMESAKYKDTGTGDVVSTDGGFNNYVFEGGSNLSL